MAIEGMGAHVYGREIDVKIDPPDADRGSQFRVRLSVDGKVRHDAYYTDRSDEEEPDMKPMGRIDVLMLDIPMWMYAHAWVISAAALAVVLAT